MVNTFSTCGRYLSDQISEPYNAVAPTIELNNFNFESQLVDLPDVSILLITEVAHKNNLKLLESRIYLFNSIIRNAVLCGTLTRSLRYLRGIWMTYNVDLFKNNFKC